MANVSHAGGAAHTKGWKGNAMAEKVKAYWYRQDKAAYVFLAPSLIVLFLFNLFPALCSVGIAFMNLDIFFSDPGFAGIANFIKALQDERVWNALRNTLVFAGFEVVLQILCGLLAAAAVSGTAWFSKTARTVFFIPVVCSMTAVGIVWSLLLDGTIGMVPYFGRQMFGITGLQFFRDPKTAMGTVIAMTVWKNFGYTMSILVVGIQSISTDLFEASGIDGASRIRQFFHVTIPGILPNLGFCVITNLIGSIQVFDQVYVTTQGGPQYKTETLVQYIYKMGFSNPFDLGYASAISVLMLIAILTLSLPVYFKMFRT